MPQQSYFNYTIFQIIFFFNFQRITRLLIVP